VSRRRRRRRRRSEEEGGRGEEKGGGEVRERLRKVREEFSLSASPKAMPLPPPIVLFATV